MSRDAHRHSADHCAEILASERCGCFHCCETYPPARIEEWIDADAQGVGQTALCPVCGVDSVIGSASGFEVSSEFLQAMHRVWF